MTNKTELEQHTVTYPGKVDPKPGTLMGPGLNGKVWKVLGSVHDKGENQTAVDLEEYRGEAS